MHLNSNNLLQSLIFILQLVASIVIMASSNRGDNEKVEHIVNRIKWGSKTVVAGNVGDSGEAASVSSEPSAYAYKADGTPMYSQMRLTITCCTSMAW